MFLFKQKFKAYLQTNPMKDNFLWLKPTIPYTYIIVIILRCSASSDFFIHYFVWPAIPRSRIKVFRSKKHVNISEI